MVYSGAFNPTLEDPLPGRKKTQLVLKIISGQQLPKPKDSMLGDRGEVCLAYDGERLIRRTMVKILSLWLRCFQIIDPFVEVEIIGLPLDCSKQQTRVVDDNGACTCTLQLSLITEWTVCNCLRGHSGFNPMWEETLVFNIQMPEIALVRFQVWDHDPIGRDFIGQRTIALTSMMPGR